MVKKRSAKASANRTEKTTAWRRMGLAHGVLVAVVAFCVAGLIGASLWVAVTAFTQKLELARGASQIVDVTDMARHAASLEANLGAVQREDLIARLVRFGSLTLPTEPSNGYQSLTNPWNGRMIAYVLSPTAFRIESGMPSFVCAHLLLLLTKSMTPLGIKQIDIKPDDQAWRQLYLESNRKKIGETEIIAACHSSVPVTVALTFTLR